MLQFYRNPLVLQCTQFSLRFVHNYNSPRPKVNLNICAPGFQRNCSTVTDQNEHICIIGSGPAGFYAAQQIIKSLPRAIVDLYEKLPVPFGLVRYGVAPDHPEVKNVINTFTNVLQNPRVNFVGNVEVGKDVSFGKLQEAYSAILLCYGASEDRKLEIQGESEHVIPGRQFVGWYNGLPENRNLQINLAAAKRAFIIGQGNVALDIGRILLSPIQTLEKTDISPYALEALSKSKIEQVVIVGRRGPLQVAFTIKELRELVNLHGVDVVLDPADFKEINEEVIANLPRPKRRLTELLYKTSQSQSQKKSGTNRQLFMKFLRSPLKISKNQRLEVTFGVNRLDPVTERVTTTGETEIETCDLIFRSVGYKGKRLFTEIPFDESKGIIPNKNGKVMDGIYCCGWVGQGPRGVILSTMQNAFEVGKLIVQDLLSTSGSRQKIGLEAIHPIFHTNQILTTSYADYQKIEKFEKASGTKVTTVEEMLRIAKGNIETNG